MSLSAGRRARACARDYGIVVSTETTAFRDRRGGPPVRCARSARAPVRLGERSRRLAADIDEIRALGEQLVDARTHALVTRIEAAVIEGAGVTLSTPISAVPALPSPVLCKC